MMTAATPGSTALTRWVFPAIALLVAAGESYGFSIMGLPFSPAPRLRMAALVGLPAVAAVSWLGLRLWVGTTGREEDLLLTWFCAVCAVLQGILLVLAAELGGPTEQGLIIILGLLFALLGPIVGRLPHGSLFGFRTRGTLASAVTWQKTHVAFGGFIGVTGLAGMALPGLVDPLWGMVALVVGGGLTFVGTAITAHVCGESP